MEEPQDSRWKKGQSGNPNGRAAGSRNRATLAIEALLEGEGEALTRKAIELAKAGDMAALRLCLDRILPPRKDSPVAFDLPEMTTLNDAVPAMGALVKAVGQGDLTPAEAAELTKMVQAFAKIISKTGRGDPQMMLEKRLSKLEASILPEVRPPKEPRGLAECNHRHATPSNAQLARQRPRSSSSPSCTTVC
jgi:hypothetical protein